MESSPSAYVRTEDTFRSALLLLVSGVVSNVKKLTVIPLRPQKTVVGECIIPLPVRNNTMQEYTTLHIWQVPLP